MLVHRDTLQHILGADAGMLQNTRRTKRPAETRTSFVPHTVCVSLGPSGCNNGLRAYATPVARFSLQTLYRLSRVPRGIYQSQNALVERDVLHMYPLQGMEVRPSVLERVDHMIHIVRHIRAGALLGVNPFVPQKSKRQNSLGCMLEIMYALGPPLPPVRYSAIDQQHSRARDTHHVHHDVDRFRIIPV